jgi:hypothetical protein
MMRLEIRCVMHVKKERVISCPILGQLVCRINL